MNIKILTLLLCATGLSAAQSVLENDFLKLAVDPDRGATIRSLTDKKGHGECTREFSTGGMMCGAIAEDRFGGDGYPGKVTQLKYTGNTRRDGKSQILHLTCEPQEKKYSNLRLEKIFTLPDDGRLVEVQWRITNIGDEPRAIAPWIHNIVNTQYRNTVLPQKNGIRFIPPSADYFCDATRNWIGGFNPQDGKIIWFCADYSQLQKQYYCFWNGYHCMEWNYRPVSLPPNAVWHSKYTVSLGEISAVPATAVPEGILTWQIRDDKLRLEFSPAVNRADQTLNLLDANGQIISGKKFNLAPGNAIKWDIPVKALPGKKGRLTLNIPGLTKHFADKGNLLEFNYDMAASMTAGDTAPPPWPELPSPYKRLTPGTVDAAMIAASATLTVGECSPFVKVFEQDKLRAAERSADIRILRNSRFFRQFVLHNSSAEPLMLKISAGNALSNAKAKLPFSIRSVGFIATKEPSNYSPDYPVGRYPDPLLPVDSMLKVPPKSNVSLWVECFVPTDAATGVYKGNFTLTGEKSVVKLPVACQVMSPALPAQSYMRSTIGCWSLSPKLLKEVGFPGSSGEFTELCRKLYAEHRLTPRENGLGWTFDDKMEKQLELLRQRNVTTIAVPRFIVMNPAKMAKAVTMLRKHGLYEQAFYYTIDEAPTSRFPEVIAECKAIHEKYPDFKILGTIYEKEVSVLLGHVNIWCRSMKNCDWMAARLKAGDEFMTSNLPGIRLENAPFEPVRSLMEIKYAGGSGFLFWNMIGGYGKDNPWKNIACAGTNGDAHLLYPHSSGPVETLRWKYIAYGVELFDMLCMLEKSNPELYLRMRDRLNNISGHEAVEKLRSDVTALLSGFTEKHPR